MRTNKNDFTGVLDFGKQTGAAVQCNCGLNMDLDFNTKNISNRLTEEEVRDFYVTLFNHQLMLGNKSFTLRTHDVSSMTNSPEWYGKQYPCLEIHNSCSINGNGDICPCGSFGLVMGNIKTKSLKEIWHEATLNNDIFQLLNDGSASIGGLRPNRPLHARDSKAVRRPRPLVFSLFRKPEKSSFIRVSPTDRPSSRR